MDFVKVQNKSEIPFWASDETPNNSTYVTLVLVSFKYTHSCFHPFDFVNQAGIGTNFYSIPILNKI